MEESQSLVRSSQVEREDRFSKKELKNGRDWLSAGDRDVLAQGSGVWVRYLVKQADLSCGRKRDAEHKKEKAATVNAQERKCAGDGSEERVRRARARVERERVSRENANLGRIQSRISPYRRPCPALSYPARSSTFYCPSAHPPGHPAPSQAFAVLFRLSIRS